MRVATFNLESLDATTRRVEDTPSACADARLEERIDVLRPQLLRLDADILCLQEVNGQHRKGLEHRSLDALNALLEGTPYAGYHRAATTGPGGHGVADVHNLVTLSRWPIVESREIRNTLMPPLKYKISNACPPCPDPIDVSFDRAVLLVDRANERYGQTQHLQRSSARAAGNPDCGSERSSAFVWKSVSGWAEGFFISGLKRSAQALETRMMVDCLMDADPHAFILVAGDFNAIDHETPLKILAGAEEDTGNGRLAARSLAILDRSLPQDRRFSILHHGRAEMLDHILVSRSVLAHFRTIEVHNETLSDELVAYGKTQHKTASYHAPLVAEFSMAMRIIFNPTRPRW